MRLRAAALTLALVALLPAAASAQQLAVASATSTADASAAAAPISKRERVTLESRLQHVAVLEELYWTEHHSYTTDVSALEPSLLAEPLRLEIVSATADGWTARAELLTRPGVGCVVTVGTSASPTTGTVVASGGTAKGKRLSDPKPARAAVVCDR